MQAAGLLTIFFANDNIFHGLCGAAVGGCGCVRMVQVGGAMVRCPEGLHATRQRLPLVRMALGSAWRWGVLVAVNKPAR